jgi:hypothetical protein
MLAESFGIPVSTYMPKGGGGVPSWTKSTSVEINDFKNKVGEKTFTEAAQKYDIAYNAWVNGVRKNPEWNKMNNVDQNALITKQKVQLQKDIFNMYNYKYKKSSTPTPNTNLLKSINQL